MIKKKGGGGGGGGGRGGGGGGGAAGARECATPGHVLRDQWGGAGAPGGDAERRAVREIVDREGDRGARANRGRGEGDGRTRAGDRGERGADAT